MEDTGTTLAKARQDLENLYLSLPEESVELTLKDLSSFQQSTEQRKMMTNMEPNREEQPSRTLDGFVDRSPARAEQLSRKGSRSTATTFDNGQIHVGATGGAGNPLDETRWARRRPGIPHSNICALCSVTIYIFRHRCLVCGRVYCKKCVDEGMGEMTEGRKCVECLGRRFSQRYIGKAGQTGCCWRCPSDKKRQEIKWAEKGPRRGTERQCGKSLAGSRSTTPLISRNPTTRSYASGSVSPAMSRNSSTSHAGDNQRSLVTNPAFRSGHRGYPV